jgi:hypothetical protein
MSAETAGTVARRVADIDETSAVKWFIRSASLILALKGVNYIKLKLCLM